MKEKGLFRLFRFEAKQEISSAQQKRNRAKRSEIKQSEFTREMYMTLSVSMFISIFYFHSHFYVDIHAATRWSCRMGMDNGQICSMDMHLQYGYGHAALTWPYSTAGIWTLTWTRTLTGR